MFREKTIRRALSGVLKKVDLAGFGQKFQGKVRDYYIRGDQRILITTDRQSAFDVNLGYIPYKGAVLNLLSAFWFERTRQIIDNHMLAVPDPNVMIVRSCEPVPIEVIVRGYISGVTSTSIWGSYERGERVIYGLKFPEGLKKNQKLPFPVITPTTHGSKSGHDERLTGEEIIRKKIVPEKLYRKIESAALSLFSEGTRLARRCGLILVDTKYEFGLAGSRLQVMDEMHTPDSSRFWKASTYQSRFQKGLEPENFDKEFLRLWYVRRGYRGDGVPPPLPVSLAVAMSKRYLALYEMLTARKFPGISYPAEERIRESIERYYAGGRV